VRDLAPAALAVAMLGLAEAVSIARAVATRSHQRIDSNQEFIGQGWRTWSAASSRAMPHRFLHPDGRELRLRGEDAAGRRVRRRGADVDPLLIAPLTAYLPMPAMAGILLLVAFNLIDFHHITTIVRTSARRQRCSPSRCWQRCSSNWEFAIYVGVMLSLLLYLNRTSHPGFVTLVADHEGQRQRFINVERKDLPECPQLKILRVDGSLFFGAVNHFAEELHAVAQESPEQRTS